jgi:hypothetical protein
LNFRAVSLLSAYFVLTSSIAQQRSLDIQSSMADQDIVEHTLVMIPECFVFKLPPRQLATGWLAADMTEQM